MRYTGLTSSMVGMVAISLVLMGCTGSTAIEVPDTTGGSSTAPPTTDAAIASTTVFGRVVEVRRDADFRIVMRGPVITVGPATLVLDDGTTFAVRAYTEIGHACDLLTPDPPSATSRLACHAIATVDATGTSEALRIVMPDSLTDEELDNETPVQVAETDYDRLALPTRRIVESSPERVVTEDGFILIPDAALDLQGCGGVTLEELVSLPSEFQGLDRLVLSGTDGTLITATCYFTD